MAKQWLGDDQLFRLMMIVFIEAGDVHYRGPFFTAMAWLLKNVAIWFSVWASTAGLDILFHASPTNS